MKRKKALISIIITIALGWFLLSQIELGQIVTNLDKLSLKFVLYGFFLYASSYIFRALRFRILLQKDIGLGLLFNIVSLHTMWTNFLPFRSGDLSYLYLLKKKGGVETYMTGMPSLVLARVFDLLAISLLFLCSFIGVGTLPEELRSLSVILLIFIFSFLFFVMFLVWKRETFLGKVKYFILRLQLDKFKVVKKLLGTGGEILEGFKTAKSKKVILYALVFSLIAWILVYFCNFLIIKAMGLTLSLWQVFFILTFLALASVLPIQGWAGFGTVEAVWVLTVIWFGVAKETGIITGFQLHLIVLMFSTILGLTGWLFIELKRLGTILE